MIANAEEDSEKAIEEESMYQSTSFEMLAGYFSAAATIVCVFMTMLWYGERSKNRKFARLATKELIDGFAGNDGKNFIASLKGKSELKNHRDYVHDWDTVVNMVRLLIKIAEPYESFLGAVRRNLEQYFPIKPQ